MHFLAYSVPHKLTHHTIRIRFAVLLYRITDITQPLAVNGILYPYVQCFFSNLQ